MTASPLPPAARRAGRFFTWALVVLVAVAVLAVAWIAIRGYLAYGHLRDAQRQASSLSTILSDPDAVAEQLPKLADDTAAAHELTSDPVWQAASGLPWVGSQLEAVSTTIAAVDHLAGSGLAPLAQSGSGLSVQALKPTDGRFDLAAISALQQPASTAAAAAAESATMMDGVDESALLPALRTQISEVRQLIDSAQVGTDALSRAAQLLPAVLGADGPRNYLIVFQNNAEWRSLGGIVGATALIHTDGGAISLAGQASSGDFRQYPESVLPLSPEENDLFAGKPGRFIQNVTQVFSFPTTAELAQEMWAQSFGTRVDGVLAMDPVTLGYVLDATGPIELPTGDTLTSENAVSLLLNEVYQRYAEPKDQDAFFQAAAAAVFQAVADGRVDVPKLVEALGTAGEQERVLMWSAQPAEQSVLDGTTLQGLAPVDTADRTTFGVFLNDGTGSKMSYYSHVDVGVGWCADTGGAPDAALTVTLRSDAPADAASLPGYITGGGSFGVPPGTTRTVAYLTLPENSTIVSSIAEGPGGVIGFGTGTDGGRTVLTWTTNLAPGEEATARIRVRGPYTDEITARTTPVIPGNAGTISASCTAEG